MLFFSRYICIIMSVFYREDNEKWRVVHMMEINDFTQGNIVSKLLKFMIPILGALILQAMYGAVDILIVGWFGTTAGISGVSTGSSIVNLITFTITGLSMGITVLMGQYLGEKKEDRVGKVVGGGIFCLSQYSTGMWQVLRLRP